MSDISDLKSDVSELMHDVSEPENPNLANVRHLSRRLNLIIAPMSESRGRPGASIPEANRESPEPHPDTDITDTDTSSAPIDIVYGVKVYVVFGQQNVKFYPFLNKRHVTSYTNSLSGLFNSIIQDPGAGQHFQVPGGLQIPYDVTDVTYQIPDQSGEFETVLRISMENRTYYDDFHNVWKTSEILNKLEKNRVKRRACGHRKPRIIVRLDYDKARDYLLNVVEGGDEDELQENLKSLRE